MECKLKIEDRQAVVHKRINRYIMECKFIVGSKLDNIDPKELIDTLWNVNCLFTLSFIPSFAN